MKIPGSPGADVPRDSAAVTKTRVKARAVPRNDGKLGYWRWRRCKQGVEGMRSVKEKMQGTLTLHPTSVAGSNQARQAHASFGLRKERRLRTCPGRLGAGSASEGGMGGGRG